MSLTQIRIDAIRTKRSCEKKTGALHPTQTGEHEISIIDNSDDVMRNTHGDRTGA